MGCEGCFAPDGNPAFVAVLILIMELPYLAMLAGICLLIWGAFRVRRKRSTVKGDITP